MTCKTVVGVGESSSSEDGVVDALVTAGGGTAKLVVKLAPEVAILRSLLLSHGAERRRRA